MQKWIISRSIARGGLRWHIQARTEDQLSSFVVVAAKDAPILRTKAANGKSDVFTLTDPTTGATMNVVGKIKYVGEWPNP